MLGPLGVIGDSECLGVAAELNLHNLLVFAM